MTGNYPRAYWHVHITPTVIHVSLGPVCPGAECDGLRALGDERWARAYTRAYLELWGGDE